MSRVILEAKLLNVLGGEKTYLLSRVIVWVSFNEKRKITSVFINGKYYTRISYSKLGGDGYWKHSPESTRRHLDWLVKNGYLEVIKDSKSHYCGNLYRYTDKIFELITIEEFKMIANTYNAPIESKDKSVSNEDYDYSNKENLESNNGKDSKVVDIWADIPKST